VLEDNNKILDINWFFCVDRYEWSVLNAV